MKYAIKIKPYYTNAEMFWSNRHGWTPNLNDADLFSYEESMCLSLPMDGEWYMLEEE